MFFSSPVSNICTPAQVSVAMSRSDSRDSTYSHFTAQPMTVSYSTSPILSYRQPMSRTSSTSSEKISSSSMQRRESSSQWMPSPYRSCMSHSEEQHEPSSYLSDDDLLYLDCGSSKLPIETIPNPEPLLRKKEMTTEEQIAMLREMQEKEQQFEQRRLSGQQKMVRFAAEQRKVRRPSAQRRALPMRRS